MPEPCPGKHVSDDSGDVSVPWSCEQAVPQFSPRTLLFPSLLSTGAEEGDLVPFLLCLGWVCAASVALLQLSGSLRLGSH